MSNWLSVKEIAQDLNLHPDTVREWIRTKQLPASKFGSRYRIRREDYVQFVKDRSTERNEQKESGA